MKSAKQWLLRVLGLTLAVLPVLVRAEEKQPLVIGLTAEFGMQGSHAAQSIEKGILLAIDEVNAAGGVLGGRKLVLESKDDRGVPVRGIDNFKDFAAKPEVVGVFCGRFSPVAIEIAPFANSLGLPLLDPWAAADSITELRSDGPNYVFRLSLNDSWALGVILDDARRRKLTKVALLVPNTAWGRSGEAALVSYQKKHPELRHETFWYNWGDTEFTERLLQAKNGGAQLLVMVANEAEGLPILRQMAALPAGKQLPTISHWGILGGDFAKSARDSLGKIDFKVIHTFSFADRSDSVARTVADSVERRFGEPAIEMKAQVGFAHAYDLTHLLAKAIDKAKSSDRAAIRSAMESLPAHQGLVRKYQRPFSPQRHEALEPSNVNLGRYDANGILRSVK